MHQINENALILKNENNAFERIEALLDILKENNYTNFCTDSEKIKKEILHCLNELLKKVNTVFNDDEFIKLWIPYDTYSDEADEHYCELIRFGGYEILYDGEEIVEADVIILQKHDGNQTLDCYTYQNINSFCNQMKIAFDYYENDIIDVDDDEYIKESNKELNDIIDEYWMNTIEYDYYCW